jgi:general secretion pathway protein D
MTPLAPFRLIALATALALAPAAFASDAAPIGGDEKVTLNFVDADIATVVKALGLFTQRNFVLDGRVKGKINLVSPRALTRDEAYATLLSALRLQGFTVVEAGGVAKVVPEADAKLHGAPASAGEPAGRGDRVVTRVFKLRMESASNLLPVLRPLISPNNAINAYPANNSLVITDYADNVARLAQIIDTLDNPKGSDVQVVPLKYAMAADMAPLLQRSLDEAGGVGGAPGAPGAAGADPGQRVAILADTRSNRLVLRSASPARLALALRLLHELDHPSHDGGNMHVVYLKNAEAVRLAAVLRAVVAGEAGGTGLPAGQGFAPAGTQGFAASAPLAGFSGQAPGAAGAVNPAGGAFSAPGTAGGLPAGGAGGMIQADAATNSLIITAPDPVYRNLRQIIDKLDMRRAQVYVESLIVEVAAERLAEFGIQWQALSSGANAFAGTNFNPVASGSNIIGLGNGAVPGQGLNLGLINTNPLKIGDITIGNLGLLARALETNLNANVLSTPNLMTLDNEEARIIVGQNVPFVTGQYATTGNTATVNPFQTVERRDVGLTLKVKPQISEGGAVRLQIYQETSKIATANNRTANELITTDKRAIESTVLVDDGQIFALGGLIEDTQTGSVEKVPWLGDLPVFGGLFRYDNRRRIKTNLIVFLRPYVVRSPEDTRALVTDRYDYLRQKNLENQPEKRWSVPDLGAPLLPDLDLRSSTRQPSTVSKFFGDPALPAPAPAQVPAPAASPGTAPATVILP